MMGKTELGSWDHIDTWELVLPPSRPSKKHLGFIKRILKDIATDKPIAVLGCTPEFRDVLFELGFSNCYYIDNNEHAVSVMNSLRIYPASDKLIQGDWIEVLGKYKNHFQVILSDLTSGNIPYEKRELFYERITSSLTKRGLFIDKVLTHQKKKKKLIDLQNKYLRLPLNLQTINYFSCDFLFNSELLDLDQTVNSSLFYDILEKKYKNQRIKKLMKLCTKITPRNCIWWYGKPWGELKRSYCTKMKQSNLFEEEVSSPYYNGLKYILNQKR